MNPVAVKYTIWYLQNDNMGKTTFLICRLICIALFFSNCAGFDDWAGLDVFDDKIAVNETKDYFYGKRYVLPGLI